MNNFNAHVGAWIVSKVKRKVFYQIYKKESSGFYLR
jgi:hypothetical protein